jgi:glycosyltransferase involved in cell wall biosynthesis
MSTMTDRPLVSAIIPVYEPDEDWLIETVNSVLNQTYENIELVLVNDGSSKRLIGYLNSEILDDERILQIEQENQGFTGATNTAIKEAKGKYIAPIGQDDIWKENKIERQVESLDKDEKICYTKSEIIDEDGNFLGEEGCFPPKERYKELKLSCYPCYESLLISREFLEDLDGLNEEFDIVSDYDLWFRSWPKTKINYVDEPLVSKRHHKENTSNASTKLLKEGEKVRRTHIEDNEILNKSLSKFFRRNGKGFFESGNKKRARETWLKAFKNKKSFKTLFLILSSVSQKTYDISNKVYAKIK